MLPLTAIAGLDPFPGSDRVPVILTEDGLAAKQDAAVMVDAVAWAARITRGLTAALFQYRARYAAHFVNYPTLGYLAVHFKAVHFKESLIPRIASPFVRVGTSGTKSRNL